MTTADTTVETGKARLSAAWVKSTTKLGRHGDGGRGSYGLSLMVREGRNGGVSKAWAQRLRWDGQPFNLGLGSYPAVSLKDARQAAMENAKLVSDGIDPRVVPATVPTVQEAMEEFISLRRKDWKGAKYESDVRRAFRLHVLPKLGNKPVNTITPNNVVESIKPVAASSTSTATKLRSWLKQTFDIQVGLGNRDTNPVMGVNAALPKAEKGDHRQALPHTQVIEAVETIRNADTFQYRKLAFEFVILTATRSGETRGATWNEFDLKAATWTIPADRMKSGKIQRIPLSRQALDVLAKAKELSPDTDLVFPTVTGKVQHDNAFSILCRDLGIKAVPHGFRSSFRDWCAETEVNRQVAESALAHALGDATETAYLRTDLLALRRALMQDWADYAAPVEAEAMAALAPVSC